MIAQTRSQTTLIPKDTLSRLVVPVDASSASQRAADLAVRIATGGSAEIVLVALLPEPQPYDDLDRELLEAQWMASERGIPPIEFPAADEESRRQDRYEFVLLPLRRRIASVGLPVQTRLLTGKGLEQQFRDLLNQELPKSAVVLNNPRRLQGPLRDLTRELWAEPQCTTYVADVDSASPSWGTALRGLLRRVIPQ
jgi:nucleotide-binding universal stress UspA family protein